MSGQPRHPRTGSDRARSPRRGPTRWLLITPLVGLAAVVAGVMALQAVTPQEPPDPSLGVELPPLALEDEIECVRRIGDPGTEEVRERYRPGGRVSSAQVVRCPTGFDGLEVTYAGEVVGELLPREGGVWAQVNDDAYALETGPLAGHAERAGFNSGLSVWLPDGLHERLEAPGRPGRRGDVILVRGTVERTDPQDGGGTTVRAEELEVLADPVEVEAPLHLTQAVVAGVLVVLAVAAVLWARRARRG